jgi:hypothetical protein
MACKMLLNKLIEIHTERANMHCQCIGCTRLLTWVYHQLKDKIKSVLKEHSLIFYKLNDNLLNTLCSKARTNFR